MWLFLQNDISKKFKFSKKYTYLLDLKKINIIVGKNNSGKSYFMREIIKNSINIVDRYEIKDIVFSNITSNNQKKLDTFYNIIEFKKINDKYINILTGIQTFNDSKIQSSTRMLGGKYPGVVYDFENFVDLKNRYPDLLTYLGFNTKTDAKEFSDKVVYEVTSLTNKVINQYKIELEKEFDNLDDEAIYQFGKVIYDFGYIEEETEGFINLYNISEEDKRPYRFKNYIPLLRNIRHPLKNPNIKEGNILDDIYKTRILEEYKYNENEINIITGLNFYFEYKEKLLGSKRERKLISDFEKFLSNYFFEGKDISIIPDEKSYEVKININDSEDRFIYEVGDGITSLIIMMYNIFLNCDREKNIYFIEEPEQSFHPGFQRLLINIISLNPKFKNCYFFFTTHSNHLIDISNHDFKNFINYLCKKNGDNINVTVQNESDISMIYELGVKPSSVQIANKIIWVEGKYDAFYIRLLLNKKNINESGRKYIEDYDYVFVPYGGSNGTLINFSLNDDIDNSKDFILKAKKINKDFLLIMDDDEILSGNNKQAKIDRYNKLKEILDKQLYKLEVREIENLFPTQVIKDYFLNGLKCKDYDLSFLDNIKYDDYKNKKLGRYLNGLIKKNIGNDFKQITGREKGFELKGFLYSKSKFYDCVLRWIMNESFDYEKDIPQEAKQLIDKVENFIKD